MIPSLVAVATGYIKRDLSSFVCCNVEVEHELTCSD